MNRPNEENRAKLQFQPTDQKYMERWEPWGQMWDKSFKWIGIRGARLETNSTSRARIQLSGQRGSKRGENLKKVRNRIGLGKTGLDWSQQRWSGQNGTVPKCVNEGKIQYKWPKNEARRRVHTRKSSLVAFVVLERTVQPAADRMGRGSGPDTLSRNLHCSRRRVHTVALE